MLQKLLVDGFQFLQWEWSPGKRMLVVESDRLNECIAYCNARQIDGLSISPVTGYGFRDLQFLRECQHVVALHFTASLDDMCGLYDLPRLTYLSTLFQHHIDFARLQSLSDLTTEWNRKIDSGLTALSMLRRLVLRKYKPKLLDLSDLCQLQGVQELRIIQSSVRSIEGIGNLRRLNKLELSYCPNLENIHLLREISDTLEEVELDHCPRITDWEILGTLSQLRKLIIFQCSSLPSLKFVDHLKHLEFLSFVNTDVLDGDMTPCFALKYAGFLKKKHYSHTPEEVRRVIETRIGRSSLYR